MMAISVQSTLIPGGVESARCWLQDLSRQGVFTPYGWERVLIEDKLEASGELTISYLMNN